MTELGIPLQAGDVQAQSWAVGEEIAATRRRLGAAAGATALGVAIIDIPAGKRPNPPHSHADEEEIFLVLSGSGYSYQTSGSKDARMYAIGVDDVLVHPANGDAHTLIAGPDGLSVFVVAEGSRTHITYLPRTRQFFLGGRWLPAEGPHPFYADSELPPLELPEPAAERPETIKNLAELELQEGSEGKLAWAFRKAPGRRLVLGHDAMPPNTHNTELHFHSAREEGWYVRGGSGVARIGSDGYELKSGTFWLRPPNLGAGHRIEVGEEGLDLITFGDLVGGDVCAYPEKGTVKLARGVEVPYTPPTPEPR